MLTTIFFFLFYGSATHRDLHSFPTRRSSDLDAAVPGEAGRALQAGGAERRGYCAPPGGQERAGDEDEGAPPRRLPERDGEGPRSEEHTSELQSRQYLVCRLLLEKKKHRCNNS